MAACRARANLYYIFSLRSRLKRINIHLFVRQVVVVVISLEVLEATLDTLGSSRE